MNVGAIDALERQRLGHMIEAVARLRMDADLIARHEARIADGVAILRLGGASWATIGEALRISRQAAQQRFGAK